MYYTCKSKHATGEWEHPHEGLEGAGTMGGYLDTDLGTFFLVDDHGFHLVFMPLKKYQHVFPKGQKRRVVLPRDDIGSTGADEDARKIYSQAWGFYHALSVVLGIHRAGANDG